MKKQPEHELKSGERRIVTVLFSDIQDFTRLTGQMDPEEMDSLMNRIFKLYEETITAYGGVVEKYIGDALVAVFGVPKVHDDDASRAVNAALDFQAASESLKEERLPAFRTGIHKGLITTGKRGNHDVVTGPVMNLAARLEAACPEGGILVSEAVKMECDHEIAFEPGQSLSLKGFDHNVKAYLVSGRVRNPLRYENHCIGRTDEVNRILKSYMVHDPAKISGYYITGTAGIGKSRLAAAAVDKISSFPDFSSPLLYARVRQFKGDGFESVLELISGFLGVTRDTDKQDVLNAASEKLEIDEEIVTPFCQLLHGGLESLGENRAFMFLYLILNRIMKRSENTPYPPVLVIDNVSNLDRRSRDFFTYYIRNATNLPFVLFTSRTEDPEIRKIFDGIESLMPGLLNDGDALSLLAEVYGGDLDSGLARQIIRNAGGVPLFLEEYAQYLKDSDDPQSIPPSIQTMYMSHIENYDQGLRDFLKKMSCFLVFFSREDAVYLETETEGTPDLVDQYLEQLIDEEVLSLEGTRYIFRIDLMRKTLYTSILNHNRRIIHSKIADLLKMQHKPVVSRLLHHLVQAGRYEEAAEVLYSDPSYPSNLDYVEYLDIFVKELPEHSSETRLKYLFTKAAILFNVGQIDEADILVKQMITEGLQNMNNQQLSGAYHLLTAFFTSTGRYESSVGCAQASLSLDTLSDSRKKRQNIYFLETVARTLKKDFEGARKIIDKMECSDTFNWRDWRHLAQTSYYLHMGRYAEALEYIYHGSYSPDQELLREDSKYGISCVFALHGLEEYKQLLEIGDLVENQAGCTGKECALLYCMLAEANYLTGREARAAEYLRQAEYQAFRVQNDFDRTENLTELTGAYLLCGRPEKALQLARQGLSVTTRYFLARAGMSLLSTAAEAAYQLGKKDETRFLLQQAELIREANILFNREDLISYHLLSAVIDESGQANHLDHLKPLLEEHRKCLGTDKRYERYLEKWGYDKLLPSQLKKTYIREG